MHEMALYNLWKRFSAWKESVYSPAIAEVKAFSESDRLLFCEYACTPENLASCGREGYFGFFPPKSYFSVWQRFVEILPAQPEDARYLPILLNLRRYGLGYLSFWQKAWDKRPLREEDVTVLSAPLRFCLAQVGADAHESLPSETRKMLLELLESPFADVELTLAVLEKVPLLYDERFLPWLNELLIGGRFTPDRRRVADAADVAYGRLKRNIKKREEYGALLRPADPPSESDSLLRPARDPIETKPEELLRPVEPQDRNE